MHQHSTSGIRRRSRRRRHSTCWHMAQCEGVSWLLWWFALLTNIRDIRERNTIIRNEIWTTSIRSLRFGDIRERVTLRRLILQSLGCKHMSIRPHLPFTFAMSGGGGVCRAFQLVGVAGISGGPLTQQLWRSDTTSVSYKPHHLWWYNIYSH